MPSHLLAESQHHAHNMNATAVDPLDSEMEAKMRRAVVESRRKLKALGENALCPDASQSHSHSTSVSHYPPAKPTPQELLSILAAQHQRLADEIAHAKTNLAQLRNQKPKSTMEKRMQRRELWPESNPHAMILDISDDDGEEKEEVPLRKGKTVLGAITNRG